MNINCKDGGELQWWKRGFGLGGQLQADASSSVQFASHATAWSEKEITRGRYGITDLCDDMKTPRSQVELVPSAARLYEVLTDFYFRAQNKWSAKGKSIPRRWHQVNPGKLGARRSRDVFL